jgi:predicted RNA binding protein YcfA (HicA-like mRNA interferase family)
MPSSNADLLKKLQGTRQKDWIRAGARLGFVVDTSRGKGSHVVWLNPDQIENGMVLPPPVLTIPKNIYPVIVKKMFNQLKAQGVSEERIFEAFNLK